MSKHTSKRKSSAVLRSKVLRSLPQKLSIAGDDDRAYSADMEELIRERTEALEEFNRLLLQEISDRTKAEEALRQSETKYRIVADNAYNWEFWIEPEGSFVYISPSCKFITGWAAEDFIKDPELFMRIVHPDDLPCLQAHLQKVQEGLCSNSITFRIFRSDGRERWVSHVSQPVFDNDGIFLGTRGNNSDITERKQAEEALRANEERYRNLFENSPISIWEEDFSEVKKYIEDLKKAGVLDFRPYFDARPEELIELSSKVKVLDVNRKSVEFFNVEQKKDLLAGLPSFLKEDNSIKMFSNKIISLAEGNLNFTSEIPVCTDNGEEKILLLSLSVSPECAETWSRVLVSFLDITELKRTEEQLFRSKSEFEAIYRSLSDAVIFTDINRRVIMVNPAVSTMFCYSPEELIGKSAELLYAAKKDYLSMGRRRYNPGRAIDHTPFEVQYLRKDGTRFFAESVGGQVKDTRGNVMGYIGIHRDITERKKAEEYLIRAKEDLENRVMERTERLSKTNELLKLFAHTFQKKDYLEVLLNRLSEWAVSDCAGIRLLDENGNVPFIALRGFTKEFLDQEHCLSLKKDSCACARIINERPETAELPFITPAGSFVCNDTSQMPLKRDRGRRIIYCGTCVEHGFNSLAVVPIRHRRKVLGVIHFADKRKEIFTPPIIEFIESITPLVGEALYRFSVEEALVVSREQLRNLSAHLLAAREEERTKIAREIHDELGQTLTAASIELSRIKGKGKDFATAAKRIKSASRLIDTAVQDIQKICSDLRPRILDHLGLQAAIEWQSKSFFNRTGINCNLKLSASPRKLPDVVSFALFRIFQEALTNVARHSEATEISVSLGQKDKSLVLKIKDNGIGISQEQISGEKSFGILGIRERAHDLGGTITFTGSKTRGTTITVKIPLERGGTDVYHTYRRRSSDRPAGA
jgi:PAS domain S-box-containing protein